MKSDYRTLDLRPYQLVHIVAVLGANPGCDAGELDFGSARLNAAVREMRALAYVPVRLRANVTSIYAFQNPGHDEDTEGGATLNTARDLDILQRLGLVPGVTMPAIDLFDLLLTAMPTVDDIVGYGEAVPARWAEGPAATADGVAAMGGSDAAEAYRQGVARGLGALFLLRKSEEMARVKQDSAKAMLEAKSLRIRPHHLMCMTCFYGGREGELAPIEEDNLCEAIVAMQRNPEIPVTLVQGPCMICPPCPYYDQAANLCYLHVGIGLRDEKKDTDVLRLLGLDYGDTLPAKDLLALLYERVPSTKLVCGYKDGIERGPSWRICDNPEGSERYRKGRAQGIGVVGGLEPNCTADR